MNWWAVARSRRERRLRVVVGLERIGEDPALLEGCRGHDGAGCAHPGDGAEVDHAGRGAGVGQGFQERSGRVADVLDGVGLGDGAGGVEDQRDVDPADLGDQRVGGRRRQRRWRPGRPRRGRRAAARARGPRQPRRARIAKRSDRFGNRSSREGELHRGYWGIRLYASTGQRAPVARRRAPARAPPSAPYGTIVGDGPSADARARQPADPACRMARPAGRRLARPALLPDARGRHRRVRAGRRALHHAVREDVDLGVHLRLVQLGDRHGAGSGRLGVRDVARRPDRRLVAHPVRRRHARHDHRRPRRDGHRLPAQGGPGFGCVRVQGPHHRVRLELDRPRPHRRAERRRLPPQGGGPGRRRQEPGRGGGLLRSRRRHELGGPRPRRHRARRGRRRVPGRRQRLGGHAIDPDDHGDQAHRPAVSGSCPR